MSDPLDAAHDTIERAGRVSVTPAADIEPESPRWCWQGLVPLGGVTVVAGQPGLGKSTLALFLAARVSTGTLDGDLLGYPANAMVITLEDHAAMVVRPRLQAAHADLEGVHLMSASAEHGQITLPEDLEAIEYHVEERQTRLLVIDPVVATLSGDLDSHRDHQIRRALSPLAQLAERHDLAVIAVMHFSKRHTSDLLSRVSGSVGFGGAARSVLAFVREPDDEAEERSERVIVHAKSNWGIKAGSLAARIETAVFWHQDERIETSRLRITGPSNVTAADLATDNADRSEADDATEFLRDVLADGSWHERKEIDAESKRRGISRRTLYRAASKLADAGELERQRIGFPAVAHWRIAVVPTAPKENGGTTGETPVTTRDSCSFNPSVVPKRFLGTTEPVGTTVGPPCCCVDGGVGPNDDDRCTRCYGTLNGKVK
jgi:hypothetical protein